MRKRRKIAVWTPKGTKDEAKAAKSVLAVLPWLCAAVPDPQLSQSRKPPFGLQFLGTLLLPDILSWYYGVVREGSEKQYSREMLALLGCAKRYRGIMGGVDAISSQRK